MTINPIRSIVDVLAVQPNPHLSLINLHLGDPTLTGTLLPPESVLQAVQDALVSRKFNGYGPAIGLLEVREQLANHISCPEAPVRSDDLILTSGCSHALQLAIEAIANSGDNILVPSPGFPLYSTLMKPHGIEDRFYRLDLNNGAQVDLAHLDSLIDDRTRAIILNNPSNPTGSVYSKDHLEAILKVAQVHRIPIIADEIYGDLTYDGAVFYPMASLQPQVPILTCDGIAKRYLVPGWRLGWLVIHDRFGVLRNVADGIRRLAQKIVGPCALMQGALPSILRNTPSSFFKSVTSILATNASLAYCTLSDVPGLLLVRPQGAMYMMVGFDTQCFPSLMIDDMELVKRLITEESVYCLPGVAFHSEPGWIRLVLTYSPQTTLDACKRIVTFSARYYKSSPSNGHCSSWKSESASSKKIIFCNDKKFSCTQIQ